MTDQISDVHGHFGSLFRLVVFVMSFPRNTHPA